MVALNQHEVYSTHIMISIVYYIALRYSVSRNCNQIRSPSIHVHVSEVADLQVQCTCRVYVHLSCSLVKVRVRIEKKLI